MSKAPSRRAEGVGRRSALCWGSLLLLAPTRALRAAPAGARRLRRRLRGALVDWQAGLVLAEASQAADFSLPGPEVARAASSRRARRKALDILGRALPLLPLSRRRKPAPAQIRAALARARDEALAFDSAGGAVVEVSVAFADLHPDVDGGKSSRQPAQAAAPEAVVLAIAAMPLEAAPVVRVGKSEVTARSAVYRLGPAPPTALRARRDGRGRLVIKGGAQEAGAIVAGGVTIYLKRVGGA